MKQCLFHHNYVDEKAKTRCLFPLPRDVFASADRDFLQTKLEIQKIPVVDQSAAIAAGQQSHTGHKGRQAKIAQNIDAEKNLTKMLISTLHSSVKGKVVDGQTVTVISHTRTVLNLPDIARTLSPKAPCS